MPRRKDFMKNFFILLAALILIGTGLFLGIGIRTKTHVVEKSITLEMTENHAENNSAIKS